MLAIEAMIVVRDIGDGLRAPFGNYGSVKVIGSAPRDVGIHRPRIYDLFIVNILPFVNLSVSGF